MTSGSGRQFILTGLLGNPFLRSVRNHVLSIAADCARRSLKNCETWLTRYAGWVTILMPGIKHSISGVKRPILAKKRTRSNNFVRNRSSQPVFESWQQAAVETIRIGPRPWFVSGSCLLCQVNQPKKANEEPHVRVLDVVCVDRFFGSTRPEQGSVCCWF